MTKLSRANHSVGLLSFLLTRFIIDWIELRSVLLLLSASICQKCILIYKLNIWNRFEGDKRIQGQVAVSVISDTELCGVTFYSSPELERENLLCKLHFRLATLKRDFKTTPVDFFGVPVSDKILLLSLLSWNMNTWLIAFMEVKYAFCQYTILKDDRICRGL